MASEKTKPPEAIYVLEVHLCIIRPSFEVCNQLIVFSALMLTGLQFTLRSKQQQQQQQLNV